MNIVIVESPAKAKTINKYLGSDYQVLASYGHVRDLPAKDGSVLPDDDFAMTWDVDAKSQKRLNDIVRAVKGADRLILATDPDREGEAISWHVLEVLRQKKALKDMPVQRVVFNAITKKSVLDAMANPRDIDEPLVDAYLARRALDYLVGFNLSPVLWRKLPGARSAGRVQSVCLRLIVEREMEIEAFQPREYWSVKALLATPRGKEFEARLVSWAGKKLDRYDIPDQTQAELAVQAITSRDLTIAGVEAKPTSRNPSAPFMTSTLQQEASRKFGMGARQTMSAAQRLYEAGLITYMRTDGIDMAPEAVHAARDAIADRYGAEYVPDSPRMYKNKAKNAQEAHECIRPTSFTRPPETLKSLDSDQYKLYSLIWKRALASQMEAARLESTTIEILSTDQKTGLRATGSVLVFDGFLKVYSEGRDDSDEDEDGGRLPKVTAGAGAAADKIETEQHFTQPPPRFTEASLVKRLEELGIGRPSTYASIISVLQDRSYVTVEKNRFIPDDKGRIVTAFLENFFQRYVEYDFTANLEETLDSISDGKAAWKEFLQEFWDEFYATVEGMSDLRITEVLDALNEALGPHIFPPKEDGSDPRLCPSCKEGRLSLKIGRFGAFIGCERYDEGCKYTKQLSQNKANDGLDEDKVLGIDPNTSLKVYLRAGRFGPYVQLGEEDKEAKEKPKRASVPKDWGVANIDLDKGLMLLSLPREVGPHPEDGKVIEAAIGRYGPYVKHGKTYANLESTDEVFEIGLNRAVTVIAEKKANPGRGRGQQAKPVRELGDHPQTGEPVAIFDGRYGPYVKHMKTNATIPGGVDPDQLTLDHAVELIAARDAKGSKKKATKKKTTKKKATKKKAAKKKTASKSAKKTTGKKAKTGSEG